MHDRFCRFDRYETTDRKWNPKKGKFDEVDLLTKEEAYKEFEIEYRKVAKDCKGRDLTDKEWEYFHNYYTPAFTYKALNRLIQGSAADMTKKAMVDLYELGIVPHIQIHDELCLSVENDYKANIVQNSMESAIPLEIKNKVNYKKGKNWGSIK